jgi:hypothetical protein
VVREELDGPFTKNAERMVGHASRELDRSLKRYWQLWERLQLAQPTIKGQEEIPEAGSASSADAEGTSSQGAGLTGV